MSASPPGEHVDRSAPSWMHRTVWLATALHMLLVLAAAASARLFFEPNLKEPQHDARGLPHPFEQLIRWDANWYVQIAEQGYNEQAAAFFPVLPAAIRLFSLGGRLDSHTVGLLVCNLAMVGVFYLLARLGSMHFDRRTAGRAVFVLAVMPTSFFFNSIYSESLFLMFVLASLLFAYEKKWLLAGLAGALAAGTRNLGLGLALILFIEAFRAYGRPSRAMLASAIVPLGLIGLMAYHYFVLSDPLAFLKAQQYWEREFQWPWMGLINGYKELLDNLSPRAPFSVLRNFLNALLATMCIACLVAAAVRPRLRVPLSWQLLCWMFLLAPLFSGTDRAALYSIDRFVLVIPVTYYMLALLPNYVFRPWLVISAALLVFSTMGFCTWHFIG